MIVGYGVGWVGRGYVWCARGGGINRLSWGHGGIASEGVGVSVGRVALAGGVCVGARGLGGRGVG